MKMHEYFVLSSAGLILFFLALQGLRKLYFYRLPTKEKVNLRDWFQSAYRFWGRFKIDQAAVTAVEYALIAAFIVLIVVAGIKLMGRNTNSTFNTIATSV